MPKKKRPSRPSGPPRGARTVSLPTSALPASTLPAEQRLAAALEAQDAAAVAFALRNDHVIVPLLPEEGPPQVRVFRQGEAEKYMLLLFSSPQAYAAMLPEESDHRVLAYDRATLTDFIQQNIGVLEAIWFDLAGPHSMQAEPQDVLDALLLEADPAAAGAADPSDPANPVDPV